MNNVGVISIYSNGVLINSDFSRVNGINFTGAGVTINSPSVSLIGGIGIANIDIRYTQIENAIGGDANLSYLNVNPGISTVGFLTGAGANFSGIITASSFNGNFNCSNASISGVTTSLVFKSSSLNLKNNTNTIINDLYGINGNFTGILTASKYFGAIYASQGLVSGVTTATQYLSGKLEGDYIISNNLNCGIATVRFLNGINASYSGIITAPLINANNINTNSIKISGISTFGLLNGSSAYFTGITTVGFVTSINLIGTLTGPSSISGNTDISNVLFTGNIDTLLNQFKILPSYRRIIYIDGDVVRTSISDTASATSGITTEMWIDMWDNSSIHGISTSGWTRGTAPGSGTTAYTIGSRQCFSNINQVFRWLDGRNPSDNSTIIINLYKTSSSNVGLATGVAAVNNYLGKTRVNLQRGPSQPRLSIGATTYVWGPEHYSGHFSTPNATLSFYEVNLNCAGISTNPDRHVSGRNTYVSGKKLIITTSKFKYIYDGSVRTDSTMFSILDGSIQLNWQKNYNIYNSFFNDNTNEFIFSVLNTAFLPSTGRTNLFSCKDYYLDTTRGENGNYSSANLNITLKILNQVNNPTYIIFSGSAIFDFIGGINNAQKYYGGINMNLDISQGNIQNLYFMNFSNVSSKFVYILDADQIHSEININTVQNVSSDISNFFGFYLDNSYVLYSSLDINNNLGFIKKIGNSFSPIPQRTLYRVGPGSVFNSIFYKNETTETL